MPFIVTTKVRVDAPDIFRPEHEPERIAYAPESRRAVATLDEAREECIQTCPEEMWPATLVNLSNQIAGLKDSGGTVAYPDGTVIEVKAWASYRAWATYYGEGVDGNSNEVDILAAFNAAQGVEA